MDPPNPRKILLLVFTILIESAFLPNEPHKIWYAHRTLGSPLIESKQRWITGDTQTIWGKGKEEKQLKIMFHYKSVSYTSSDMF